MDVQEEITLMCDAIAQMLVEKNRKYGNSALDPVRVFSKADLLETIKVRMDDKLCRIRNEQADEDEDVYMDLAGYLVLYLIARKRQNGKDWLRSVSRGEPETHLEAAKPRTFDQIISEAASQLHAEKAKREALLAERGYKLDGYVVINSVGKRMERNELALLVDCMGDAEKELRDALGYYLAQYPKQPDGLKAAKAGMRPGSVTLILDDKGPLTQFKYGGDLSDTLRTGKASSVAGIDKMSPESLDCLLCQAQESGDYNLVKQIQDEQDRRDSVDKPKNQILFKGRPISMATDKELTDTLDRLLTGENKYRPDALSQIGYLADECTRRGIALKPFARHLDADDVTPTT